MTKIGFIDYYLDNWHFANYPKLIHDATGGKMEVACVCARIDRAGGKSNAQLSKELGIPLYDTAERVIEDCDRLIVCAPATPEVHKELCELPLASGKPTYVDKVFAPDTVTAEYIFAHAKKHHTPVFSSSALRFSKELEGVSAEGVDMVVSRGPNDLDVYSIHQIENIVAFIRSRPLRIISTGTRTVPLFTIEFESGARGSFALPGDGPFVLDIHYRDGRKTVHIPAETDYFPRFIKAMVRFFETGEVPVESKETVWVIRILEYAKLAAARPDCWLDM
jgi:hypothetical protein